MKSELCHIYVKCTDIRLYAWAARVPDTFTETPSVEGKWSESGAQLCSVFFFFFFLKKLLVAFLTMRRGAQVVICFIWAAKAFFFVHCHTHGGEVLVLSCFTQASTRPRGCLPSLSHPPIGALGLTGKILQCDWFSPSRPTCSPSPLVQRTPFTPKSWS